MAIRSSLREAWAPGRASIFRFLSEAQLARLCSEQVWHTYGPGQSIYYEGTPALAVFHLDRGFVKLWRAGHAGDRHTVGWLGPGEVIGLRNALLDGPCHETAEPMSPVTVATIRRDLFVGLLRENHEFACAALELLAHRTAESEEWIMSRVLDSVIRRTARVLLLFQHEGAKTRAGEVGLMLPQKREVLADLIGTSTETLCRTLHVLRDRSVIDLDNHRIHVKDWQALQELVE